MSHKKIFVRSILLMLLILAAGCSEKSTATPCPTSIPQICPTTAAQAPHVEGGFLATIVPFANATITFDPGDQCYLDILSNTLVSDTFALNIVVNDQTYQDYFVTVFTLDSGKTITNMKNIIGSSVTGAPPGANSFLYIMENPGDNSHHGMIIDRKGPFYIFCAVGGADGQKFINILGPLEIK